MDFRAYEAAPGISVIVLPDVPRFTHVAVSNDFIKATGMRREDVIGKGHFEIFPKSPGDPNFSGEQNLRSSFQYIIQNRTPHEIPAQRYDIPNGDGTFQYKYWKINNAPILGATGEVLYIVHTAIDITDQIRAERHEKELVIIEKQHQELQFVLDFMPQMVWYTQPDGSADFFNQEYLDYSGLTLDQLRGDRWTSLIHPDDVEETNKVWLNALQQGHGYEVEHRLRGKEGTYHWFLTRGRPLKDNTGTVVKWYGTTTDIQDQKEAAAQLEQRVQERTSELEQQRSFADSVLDASINGLMALDAVTDEKGKVVDFTITLISKQFTAIIGLDQSAVGKSYLSLFNRSITNGIFAMYKEVFETGIPQRKEIFSTNLGLNGWFDISAAKRSENGIVASVVNITHQREAALRLEEQKNLLGSILKHSPAGVTVYHAIRNDQGEVVDFQCILANDAAERFTGISTHERYSKTVLELTPALRDTPLYRMAVKAVEEGTPFRSEYFNKDIGQWLELSVVNLFDSHIMNVFRDITPIKETQLALEESVSRFKAVFDAAQSGMFTFSPVLDEKNEIIDFRFVVTNPTFAAYVGQTPEVLNGELGSTWFPGYLTNGVFDMYKDTYLTGETRRCDIHYNVDQHDIYLDLQSTKIGNEVLITFTDYTQLKKAQLQLERNLEELRRSNANLEEFAYAASHDLKEPIRKINVFTDRLRTTLQDQLNAQQKHYFERVEYAIGRMKGLIDDLLMYSYITKGATLEEEVNLNAKVGLVLQDLELEIEQKGASVTVEQLPTILGHRRQLQQLFQNLIGNALKYHQPGVAPKICISSKVVAGSETPVRLTGAEAARKYYLIEVQDNGIGFHQKDAERIFHVFTRLHANEEYKGTGVGLSIAQKVVQNHGGYIWADSTPGAGATFKILLPFQ